MYTYVCMYIQYIPLLRHTVGSTSSSCVPSAEPPTAKHRETQQMRQDTPVYRHGLYIISYKYYSHTYIHIIYTHKYIRT